MRRVLSSFSWSLLAGLVLAAAAPASVAQVLSPNYTLTAPSLLFEPEASGPLLGAWGPVRVSAAGAMNGNGLSLEAGHKWFARAGLGRSLDTEALSVGGGFRFGGGDAVSMHVTRQFGQERLGLAVRYDRERAYVRLSYESRVRSPGAADWLRFSAGMRF
jgi:opacity protein-like surface antigen